MPGVLLDDRDVQFVLWEHLGAEKLFEHPSYKEFSKDDWTMILGEARKFAEQVILPLNAEGDHEGVHLKDGKVQVPKCYRPAYDAFCEAGWGALSSPPEYGGQGLPNILGIAVSEYCVSACIAFSMYTGLTRAAADLIHTYGTDPQKQKYLPNMIAGKWGGTMCLTEAGAGSAVGDLKSTAKKRPDGTFSISGSKIFISSGDHDLVENNIHLVLARAEGSPPGIKGISLFIVPKYRIKPDGSLGEFNNVECPKVEEKMGIHGSATCELLFGDKGECIGELIFELNKGIVAMFQMMNEARIGTGLQGQGCAAAAYQLALKYAKERVQGVAIENMRDVNAPRVEIIKHPDVRRMLLSMKAMTEGMRALIYRGVFCNTLAELASDPKEKEKWEDLLALLTPVIKAYCSDQGFLVTREAMQVLGGYGYCTEYKVEQHMRDAKISSIYEGTNGIQALDLIGRKVLDVKKQMRPYNEFITLVKDTMAKAKGKDGLDPWLDKVIAATDSLDSATKHLMTLGLKGDQSAPVLAATPYLTAFGHLCLGWLLGEQLILATQKLNALFQEKGAKDDAAKKKVVESLNEAAFYLGKIHSAKFFIDSVLPEVDAIGAYIKTNNRDPILIPENAF
ncbi:MAG: hypothetical protein A2V67_07490 [Deltaproteobacteria bacterium RBG_13_61_14]|nr:MAG: hypothetical protein A2V67_07490 [Deltaproteobacteria bacterium RBG_13_61_14]